MNKGYIDLQLSNGKLAKAIENPNFLLKESEIKEREFLILRDENENPAYKYQLKNGKLEKIKWKPIYASFGKEGSNIRIAPKNPAQELAMHMLQEQETTIKLLDGVYGSGKDILMISNALELLRNGVYEKIVYCRNNIQVKDSGDIGALPGDIESKFLPWVMPLVDHLGSVREVEELMFRDSLEVIPLGFLRGRDLKNTIIYCTEAENLTKEHIQLLIGRVGKNSALWINGDLKQTDKQVFEKNSGMKVLKEKLRGHKLFSHVYLEKSERSKTAQLADLLG